MSATTPVTAPAPGEPVPHAVAHPHPVSFASLCLGAIGVVFGDIGTSPLYALKECINPEHGFARSGEDILGILSLIFAFLERNSRSMDGYFSIPSSQVVEFGTRLDL